MAEAVGVEPMRSPSIEASSIPVTTSPTFSATEFNRIYTFPTQMTVCEISLLLASQRRKIWICFAKTRRKRPRRILGNAGWGGQRTDDLVQWALLQKHSFRRHYFRIFQGMSNDSRKNSR